MLSLTRTLLVCAGALAVAAQAPVPRSVHDPIAAVQGLIGRLLGPQYTAAFQLQTIAADPATGRDVFEIDVSNSQPVLRGNTGVALASALNWYLRYECNASVSWGRDGTGNQLQLPSTLPVPSSKTRMVSPNAWRYYMNVCTFGRSPRRCAHRTASLPRTHIAPSHMRASPPPPPFPSAAS
jgi:alpha-N-acetylglucosaminidase